MKNPELVPRVKKSLEEALGCVSHMTSKEQVDSVRYAIQRMLHKLPEARVFHEPKARAIVPSSPEIRYSGPYGQLGELSQAETATPSGDVSELAANLLRTEIDGPSIDGPSIDGVWDIDFDIFAPDLGDYFALDDPDFLTGATDGSFRDL